MQNLNIYLFGGVSNITLVVLINCLFSGFCSQCICNIALVIVHAKTQFWWGLFPMCLQHQPCRSMQKTQHLPFLVGFVLNLSVISPLWWVKTQSLPFRWGFFPICLQNHPCSNMQKNTTSTFFVGVVPNLSVILHLWWAKTQNLPFLWDLFPTCLQYHPCRMRKLNIYLLFGICSQLVCNLTLTLCKHHSLPNLPFWWGLFPMCLQYHPCSNMQKKQHLPFLWGLFPTCL